MSSPYVNSEQPEWAKSSRSGATGNCVEVKTRLRMIRDTKNRAGGSLVLSDKAATAFRQALGNGSLGAA